MTEYEKQQPFILPADKSQEADDLLDEAREYEENTPEHAVAMIAYWEFMWKHGHPQGKIQVDHYRSRLRELHEKTFK